MCFLCLWYSRNETNHFKKKVWNQVKIRQLEGLSLKHTPLVNPKNFLLLPLHIKLGLIKTFIKAMNHESAAFMNSKKKFGFLKSEAQLKEEVFIGPKIQKQLLDDQFIETLNSTEFNACKSFKQVINNFLSKYKADNFVEIVQNLL